MIDQEPGVHDREMQKLLYEEEILKYYEEGIMISSGKS